ncbi:MAG: PPC domain-containing protein, partial [Luteolibacter sp.]
MPRLFPLITVHMALITLSAHALEPISPPGGQRGTEITINLRDNNIAAFQEFITYQPGLELTNLKPNEKDNKSATATLRIAPDAALGEHLFRIRTSHDISYIRSFWVGPFPTVSEKPDEASQPVQLNTTVQGVIQKEDEDTFIVSLTKGQRLSAEAEAVRLGRNMFDARLSIKDPSGKEIAANDDSALFRIDPTLSIIAAQDGDYAVSIREAAWEGSDQSRYRLHIGTYPRPTAVFPPGGKPGETLTFTLLDDPTGPFTQTATLPADSGGEFQLFPELNGETAPSPIPVIVSSLEHTTQSGENFTKEKAYPFPATISAVDGILDGEHPERWFRFTAKKGDNLEIRAIARTFRSPLDPVFHIRDAKGKNIERFDDDGNFPDSLAKWSAPADGEYLIQLYDQLRRTGDDFTFRIEITRRQPKISASLPITERNQSQKDKYFPVPQGNRYAAVIQLKRENNGSAIEFLTGNLPQGVRMIAPEIPKSINSFPVIFEADPTAPLASSLQAFTIRATDNKELTGTLTDTINLVEINNEGIYHSVSSDRIPIAVTDPTPFSIELEAPKNPIVSNGTVMLKMRVDRREGFKNKITTRFLWSPPGISGPASTDIPPDKSEATYELNAAADAPEGKWQVCVVAEADTPAGRRIVSSRFVALEVAAPFVSATLDLASARVGEPSAMLAKIEHHRPFQGTATAELLALPHGVTSKPIEFNAGTEEITFPLTIAPDAKPGKTTSILCKILIPGNGEKILHLTAQGGTL